MGRLMRLGAALAAITFSLTLGNTASAEIYKKGNTAEKKIALTFDDGPSRENTNKILRVLEEYDVKATFFVIGENANADPERIRKISEAGHEIGNHTYTHAYASRISEEALRKEVEKTENTLYEITGKRPTIFRPPGGYYDKKSLSVLESMGYRSVLWSVDTRDWSMPRCQDVIAQVEKDTTSGDIILFHDLEDKRLPTPKALEELIPYLIENGYQFVTVSELLEFEAE